VKVPTNTTGTCRLARIPRPRKVLNLTVVAAPTDVRSMLLTATNAIPIMSGIVLVTTLFQVAFHKTSEFAKSVCSLAETKPVTNPQETNTKMI
jgi:hypothetical protein